MQEEEVLNVGENYKIHYERAMRAFIRYCEINGYTIKVSGFGTVYKNKEEENCLFISGNRNIVVIRETKKINDIWDSRQKIIKCDEYLV